MVMIVGSAERMRSLDGIKADMKMLADPRGIPSADIDAVVNRVPVITWLVHGVHGNEISSGDAALAEAYHLLAAKNDAGVDTIMRESLVRSEPIKISGLDLDRVASSIESLYPVVSRPKGQPAQ